MLPRSADLPDAAQGYDFDWLEQAIQPVSPKRVSATRTQMEVNVPGDGCAGRENRSTR